MAALASRPAGPLFSWRRALLLCVLLPGCALSRAVVGAPAPDTVSEASVRAHMDFLAGDALNGRGSGTRDEWIAVTYVAAHMRRLGLEPMGDAAAYVQDVPVGSDGGRTWNAVGRLSGRDASGRAEVILISAHIDHLGNRPDRSGAGGGASGIGRANSTLPADTGTAADATSQTDRNAVPDDDADADTIYNGADDDASGVIAVLELMEALARGPRPRRTIVFGLWGSEERGGAGSRYFIDRAVVPLPQIVANLQFEMVGRPDAAVPPRTLWLTGYERSTLGPELARHGARVVADPHPEMGFFTRSDNIQFARRGVVAHTVSSYGLHEQYHRPSDEIETIDFPHLVEAIASLVEPIRALANSRVRPEWRPGLAPAPRAEPRPRP